MPSDYSPSWSSKKEDLEEEDEDEDEDEEDNADAIDDDDDDDSDFESHFDSPPPKPSSSLAPQSPSCQSSGAPPHTESKDSESTVGEVAVREKGPLDDHVALDLLTLGVTMAMGMDPSEEDRAIVFVSPPPGVEWPQGAGPTTQTSIKIEDEDVD
ncbi:uncharacterized protein [Miscanthus floridulus]|uniref:uncharacterized protein n=1 Tax=Miscanthus floridulus TaxID=154761 RepID=UPI00345A5D68